MVFKPEFKATMVKGKLVVHAIPERKPDGALIMHVPSLQLINKTIKEHGKRNI